MSRKRVQISTQYYMVYLYGMYVLFADNGLIKTFSRAAARGKKQTQESFVEETIGSFWHASSFNIIVRRERYNILIIVLRRHYWLIARHNMRVCPRRAPLIHTYIV